MAKIAFKPDFQKQNLLLPPSLDELIPPTHQVRVVDSIIDKLDITDILKSYQGGGNSCFHPRIMLKILVYAYLNNIYTSRRIEQQLHENIHYMWLSGGSKPDFRTINYFRGKRLKGKFEYLFTQVVELLHGEGFVSLEVQYIDGTKIESAANKYSFVWRKSVEKHEAKLKDKTHAVLTQIQQAIEMEEEAKMEEITLEDFEQKVERIKQQLTTTTASKQVIKALSKVEKENIPKMKEYKKHLQVMGGRNSYSKTDKDATFMRMKEDHMGNGQLKPGYNVQISTENQFITNYGIYQRPTDTGTLIDYLKSFELKFNRQSKEVVADAGYGSLQNYEYLFGKGITPYVKYNYFHKEQKRSVINNPFLVKNLYYNKELNYYICPMGQRMAHIGKKKNVTDLAFVYYTDLYKAQNCNGCPMRGMCHKAQGERVVEINHPLNQYKEVVRDLLTSEKGLHHRSMRPIEPEAVFGHIKAAHGFRRFLLRSLPKVTIEFGLMALAHNLRKLAKIWGCKGLKTFLDSFSEIIDALYENIRTLNTITAFDFLQNLNLKFVELKKSV